MLKYNRVLAFLLIIQIAQGMNTCKEYSRNLVYYRIRSCYKSSMPNAFWRRVNDVQECQIFAREKAGLAFNFSPPEATEFSKGPLPNCQVLACPETGNLSALIMHLGYDYYSAYGDLNMTKGSTCIKSLGLFTFTENVQNYSQSILACQNASGDLADVSSDQRTFLLSQAISDNVSGWYKAAFVGLDDMETEGVFRSSFGTPLTCSK